MTSQPATPSAIVGSGQDANGDAFESLRQRLHEAEHTITGLKATQGFVVTQNAELKKENNQLREDMAVLRCQNSRAGNASNEAAPGASVTMSPEDLKKFQGILQEVKRHGSELHQKAGELRDSVLLKQEESDRKRRRTDPDTNRNEEENPAMQFLKTCKRYNSQTTRCFISFNSALEPFIEDLCIVYGTKTALCHGKRRQNLEEFLNSKNTPGWHCLREVCEKGKRSTETKILSVCPHHGSDCEFLIWKQQNGQGNISFTSFVGLKNSAK